MTDNEFMTIVKEKLSPGKYWGGYKQICELLNITHYTNNKNAKNVQLRYLERFFKYEIVKGSKTWVIEELYDEAKPVLIPGPKEDLTILTADIITKVIAQDKKDYASVRWIGTNKSIAKRIGITTDEYYKAKSNITDTDQDVKANVVPVENNVTYEDTYRFFEQHEDRVKYLVGKALDRLEAMHVIMYEDKYVIYDLEEKKFHSINFNNSEDRDRILFYNKISIELMEKYGIEQDDKYTLMKNNIDSSNYYKELNYMTSVNGFSVFKAYVIYNINSSLDKYIASNMLDERNLDEMRLELHNSFYNKRQQSQIRYTKKKGKTVNIGNNFDDVVSKNYNLVCDYLTQKLLTFKKYKDIKPTLGLETPSENDIETADNLELIDVLGGVVPMLIANIGENNCD